MNETTTISTIGLDTGIGTVTLAIVFGCTTGLLLLFVAWVSVKKRRLNSQRTEDPLDVRIPLLHVTNNLEKNKSQIICENWMDWTHYLPEKSLSYIPKLDIDRKKILRHGEIGEVHEGVASNLPNAETAAVRVAIKCLKENATDIQRRKFLEEANALNQFNHPNVLKLLGVCIELDIYWMVFELTEITLLEYLHTVRPTKLVPSKISMNDITTISRKIVDGCVFFEQVHYVHGELTVRNILLSGDNANSFVIKIANFGFTEKTYRPHEHIAFELSAPESAINNSFTHKTDVWSFGVLLWELLTLGQPPFEDVSSIEILLFAGDRLKKPKYCPIEMYKVMLSCWNLNPEKRPKFIQLKVVLEIFFNFLSVFKDETPYSPYDDISDNLTNNNSSYVTVEFDLFRCQLNVMSIESGTIDQDNPVQIPKNCLLKKELLGAGKFGKVYKGSLKFDGLSFEKATYVAIKSLKKERPVAERTKFLKEARILKDLDHPNIVKTLGICFEGDTFWIIFELMKMDLLEHLKTCRQSMSLSLKDFLHISNDVVCGCAFLEKMKYIHKDLAARNCLLTCGYPFTVKIADFGMANDFDENKCYPFNDGDYLPIRWYAPECFINGQFTHKSDVWSFGVLLWEVMTLGDDPYSDIELHELSYFLSNGNRLNIPDCCPNEINEIMKSCWDDEPHKRPTFMDLESKFNEFTVWPQYNESSISYQPLNSHDNRMVIKCLDNKQTQRAINYYENVSLENSQPCTSKAFLN